MDSFAFAALLVLAGVVLSNLRDGTLGAWAKAKFLNAAPGQPAPTELVPLAGPLPPLPTSDRGASFLAPADGSVISVYGAPRDRGARRHEGIDIGAPTGTEVRAARAGQVSYAGLSGNCGNRVDVTHGGGWTTRYCHLHRILVRRGQTVTSGGVLGTVGTTGNAEGGVPHLHFEIRRQGAPLDPLPLLLALVGASR